MNRIVFPLILLVAVALGGCGERLVAEGSGQFRANVEVGTYDKATQVPHIKSVDIVDGTEASGVSAAIHFDEQGKPVVTVTRNDVKAFAGQATAAEMVAKTTAELSKLGVTITPAIIDGLVKTDIPQFHRERYTRTSEDLALFEREFCMTAWDIAAKKAMAKNDRRLFDLYNERQFQLGSTDWKMAFPKNTNHCFRYGVCSHHDLCLKDNETRRLAYRKRTDYVDEAREKAQGEAL